MIKFQENGFQKISEQVQDRASGQRPSFLVEKFHRQGKWRLFLMPRQRRQCL